MNRIKQLAVLCAVLITLLPAAPALAHGEEGHPEPLGSRAMRSDLQAAGYSNGRLPSSLLETVPSGANETCKLEAEAAAAWELLLVAAEADGVTGFSAGWCYRSLSAQKRTYNRNCGWVQPPAPPVAEGEEPAPLPPAVFKCKVPTAKPGTSNHGWGRAVDVVDTTTSKAHVLKCSDPQFKWLRENAPSFGWVLPSWARCGSSKQEPWHWEYAGIDAEISELIIHLRDVLGVAQPH